MTIFNAAMLNSAGISSALLTENKVISSELSNFLACERNHENDLKSNFLANRCQNVKLLKRNIKFCKRDLKGLLPIRRLEILTRYVTRKYDSK